MKINSTPVLPSVGTLARAVFIIDGVVAPQQKNSIRYSRDVDRCMQAEGKHFTPPVDAIGQICEGLGYNAAHLTHPFFRLVAGPEISHSIHQAKRSQSSTASTAGEFLS